MTISPDPRVYERIVRGTIRRYIECVIPNSLWEYVGRHPIETDDSIVSYLVRIGVDKNSIIFLPPTRGTSFTRTIQHDFLVKGQHVYTDFVAIPTWTPDLHRGSHDHCYIKTARLRMREIQYE